MRGKMEVTGNKGHEQAGKADRAVVPLVIGSVAATKEPNMPWFLSKEPSISVMCEEFLTTCFHPLTVLVRAPFLSLYPLKDTQNSKCPLLSLRGQKNLGNIKHLQSGEKILM